MQLEHPFEPYYQANSRYLVLGSFPSVKSRENQFYYGHPQNRFWRVLACLAKKEPPVTIEQKRRILNESRIALWDVIQSCEITGSSDASIRNVRINQLERLKELPLEKVLFNGNTAYRLYQKYANHRFLQPICVMPSTSPANAKYRFEELYSVWKRELLL